MKVFLLVLSMCVFGSTFASENVIQQLEIKTQQQTIEQLVQTIRDMKETRTMSTFTKVLNHDPCDNDQDHRVTCVSQCSVRSSSGSCDLYDSDYCGVNAYCAENCTVRSYSGDCLAYGSDICY